MVGMKGALRVVGLAVVLVIAAAGSGLARPGFYLGYGFAGATAAGDLDGKTSATDAAANQYLYGSLGAGTGSALMVGYGFNKYFGIEYLGTATLHTATFQGQPDDNAILGTALLGVRLTAPLAKSFEAFARFGLTGYSLSYDKYALTGASQSATKVTYSGNGSAYGVGFEILGDHIGVGAGYTIHSATLTHAKADGQSSFDLPRHLNVPITTTDITFAYHFGSGS